MNSLPFFLKFHFRFLTADGMQKPVRKQGLARLHAASPEAEPGTHTRSLLKDRWTGPKGQSTSYGSGCIRFTAQGGVLKQIAIRSR